MKDQAELMAISSSSRIDLTLGSDDGTVEAHRHYVSGRSLSSFSFEPTLGCLLTADIDVTQSAHPLAVLAHDAWKRWFGADPN